VLKNKNDLETTASRKPLFHEKQSKHSKLIKAKIKPKKTRRTRGGSLLLPQQGPI
jgi:hypothetical protein